jgi:hypothetical protein
VTPEEIAEASGLAGRHVFAADPEEAANNISELPGIISSTVTLQWPNQVFIDVSEEAPIAIWMENGAEYGIAQDGRLIPAIRSNSGLLRIESEIKPDASSRSGSGAPRKLTSSNVSSTLTNAKPETSFSFIPSDVLDGALQLRELRPTIDKLYYQPQGGLSYQDGRGWRGYFGTGHEMNQKLAVYEAIVADLIAKGIQPAYVSVSNQEKPFYMIDLYPGGEVFEAEGE